MAVEIERKFLLDSDDWRRSVESTASLRQGYLGGTRCSVRVRLEDGRANLNIKSRELGRRRLEYELPLDPEDAREMLERLCDGPLVEKRRHLVTWAGHRWEIDEFEGDNAGLVVAEIELDDEGEAFERPPWLGREVTEDRRYYNVHLARHPYREWASEP